MRGLLAIEPLYNQIVAGKKTQTRRSGGLEEVNDFDIQMNGYQRSPDDCKIMSKIFDNSGSSHLTVCFYKPSKTVPVLCKSRYRVGEVLYLKEPTAMVTLLDKNNPVRLYKFGMPKNEADAIKWGNKLFMPAEAARAFIKITGIRCERLLDISDADCLAEGIEENEKSDIPIYKDYLKKDGWHANPKWSFLSLYKFANKVKEIDNIWCWVYEFTYLKDYKIENNG